MTGTSLQFLQSLTGYILFRQLKSLTIILWSLAYRIYTIAIRYFMMTFNFPDFVVFPLFDFSFFVFDCSLVSLRLYFIIRNYESFKKLQKSISLTLKHQKDHDFCFSVGLSNIPLQTTY